MPRQIRHLWSFEGGERGNGTRSGQDVCGLFEGGERVGTVLEVDKAFIGCLKEVTEWERYLKWTRRLWAV